MKQIILFLFLVNLTSSCHDVTNPKLINTKKDTAKLNETNVSLNELFIKEQTVTEKIALTT